MKLFKVYLFLVAVVLTLTSCTKEEKLGLGPDEELLTGTWNIKSVSLTNYEMGISYEGNTFFNDTILYNVGSLEIDEFSADSLGFFDSENGVNCVLNISGGQIPISLDFLFVFEFKWQISFSYNGTSDPQLIDTPMEEFYYSSNIFNTNYILKIKDINNVQLHVEGIDKNHVITLVRK